MSELLSLIGFFIKLVVIAAIVLAAFAVWGYNSLRRLAENVKESESNIEVAVRKKVSLINQLLDVASKYMDRESLVMLKVSQDAANTAAQQTYQHSGTVLSTIQGMAQRFPDLKADAQFGNLMNAIEKCESDIQTFRMRCNAAIKEYNSRRSALPHVLYAGLLGFRPAEYLSLDTVESDDARVQKKIVADDGERLNELLGMAGTSVLSAGKSLAYQGRVIAERAAVRVQGEIAARTERSPDADTNQADEHGGGSRQQLE